MHIRSPEIQAPPNNKRFTTTFPNGTYNGALIFQEPMITRESILSKPNATIPIPGRRVPRQPGIAEGASDCVDAAEVEKLVGDGGRTTGDC